MKKFITLLLCLSMILSVLPMVSAAKRPVEEMPMVELRETYESEPNDDRESADFMNNNDCMIGTLDQFSIYNATTGDFMDYYEFYLSRTSNVLIMISSKTGIGFSLVDDDASGTFLAHSEFHDYSAGYTYESVAITLPAGRYYIMISEFMSSRTDYLLALTYESNEPEYCTHSNGLYYSGYPATCTEDGFSGNGYCNDCNELVEEGHTIPATGHDYVDGYCQNCGEEEPTEETTAEPTTEPTEATTEEPSEEPTEETTEEPPEEEDEEVELPSFRDVPNSAYFADPVYWAVENGITNGTSKKTFGPDDVCTRAHVVTFLWRAAGEPKAENKNNPFKDVKKGAYYYDAVLWAVEQGITSGVSKTQFAPDAGCTRAQAVTFLWRFAGEPNLRGSAGFKDVSSGDYFNKSVIWAVDNDITKGTSNTTFSPNASCTRAQIVTFLYRADDVGALDPDYEPDVEPDDEPDSEPDVEPDDEPDYEPVGNVLVYEDSRVKVYYKEVTDSGIVFEVENNTDVTITIQADALALNYRSTENIIMSDDVAPYSIGEVIARCSIPLDGEVAIISGQLRIIDFNGSFDTYDAKFVNVEVNPNVSAQKPTPTGKLLYSDSKVKIYFKEFNNSGVVFTVENLTEVLITIQADSISINRRSTDNIIMSDDVAPYSVGDVVAKCSISGVSSAETVGGTLRIVDFNHGFRTYDATFANVAV